MIAITKYLYSSSNSGTIYRWSNIGGTPSTSNLSVSAMNSSQASAILVSPNDPTTIYVGTEAGRVVRITDANGSHTGTNISTGLPFKCLQFRLLQKIHLIRDTC